jgi:hypothetical protein
VGVQARRWIFTGIAVWALLAAVNDLFFNQPLYRQAAKIRLGQTRDEVFAVLGASPYSLRSVPPSLPFERHYYGPFQTWWDFNVFHPYESWLSHGSYGIGFGEDGYPVVIDFDANKRVSRIRYGRTVVK